MTLILRDENGKIISDDNPVVTEHNGVTGDILILPLTIENTERKFFHRNIAISVTSKPPIDATLSLPASPNPRSYFPRVEISRINPMEKMTFHLKTVCGADTPEQVVSGTTICVTSMRFPVA